jgi:hypothetical protein
VIRSGQLQFLLTKRGFSTSSSEPEPWKFEVVHAPEETVIAFAEQLHWLCACFRSPSSPGISLSRAYIQKDPVISFNIQALQVVQGEEAQEGSCWLQMFQNFVIATGFPIPSRGDQKGIELPLELMLPLSRISYPLECGDKFALKGHSTALVAMSETADSIQWHFVCQKDRAKPISLEIICKLCEEASQDTTIESLFTSPKRHFLGLWEHAEIHLGTADSHHKLTAKSGAKEETSRAVVVRELPGTIGTSGLGFFTAQIQPKLSWTRPVRTELKDEEQFLIDRIRLSGENASILYDCEQECGWLVPELNLIYELILAWATRQKHVHRSSLLALLPRAEVDSVSPAMAISDLLDSEGDRIVLPSSDNARDVHLRDLFVSMSKSFQQRKDLVELSKISGTSKFTNWMRSPTLYGWDFDDIAARRVPATRREIHIPHTSGGWEKIASTNTNVLIVLCTKAGLPIRAKDSIRTRHCDYWTPLPPPNGYLVTSVPTLVALNQSSAAGGPGLRLWPDGHCCRGKNSKMFEHCRFDAPHRECNRLQTIGSQPPKEPLVFDNRGKHGAVIFGDGARPERDACHPFEGYAAYRSTEEACEKVRILEL